MPTLTDIQALPISTSGDNISAPTKSNSSQDVTISVNGETIVRPIYSLAEETTKAEALVGPRISFGQTA